MSDPQSPDETVEILSDGLPVSALNKLPIASAPIAGGSGDPQTPDKSVEVLVGGYPVGTGNPLPVDGTGLGVTDHGALTGLADDDHTQYQKESEKGVATGYASLDVGGTVPDAQIPATIARDTEVTTAVSNHEAAGDPHSGYRLESADHTHLTAGLQGGQLDHGAALTGLTDDDHTQYLKEEASGGLASEVPDHTHASATEAGGTLAPSTFTLPASAAPAQTAEGQVIWDSDDDIVTVGDGAATKQIPKLGSTSPSTQAFGDAAAVGSLLEATRADHKHAMPANPITAHEAAGDPHIGYVLESLFDAKGDLISASADNTPAKLTAGANDTILMADSVQAAGLKWVASQTPSTQAFSDAALEGTADTYSRGDHKHGMPASPSTPVVVRKTADETVNNSAVLQDDDHLLKAIGANEIWTFELVVRVDSTANPNPGFKYAFTVPSGATVLYGTAGIDQALVQQGDVGTSSGAALSIPQGASDGLSLIKGVVVNGVNAGNLQFQWAQDIQFAANTIVKTNSYLQLVKVV